MKKYKQLLDYVLLAGLLGMSLLAVAPESIVMSTSLQMLLLAAVFVLLASFLALLWRENPKDEREASNQASASRLAYITGIVVLIVAMTIQSFQHHLDSAIPLALLAMIATKILAQRTKDNS